MLTERNHGVLPLERDFVASSLTRTKHSITRTVKDESSKTTVQIPNLSIGASRMELLCFLQEFNRASTIMGWSTGPIIFEKFPMHLQGTDLDIWLSTAKPFIETVANFHLCVYRLKRTKFLDDSYNRHLDFLRAIRLPKDFDPSRFSALLAFHNLLLSELPGAPSTASEAQLSSSELKRVYLLAMPYAWQEKFSDACKTTSNSTILDMQDYMQRQYNKYTPPEIKPDDTSSQLTNSSSQNNNTNSSQCPLPGHAGHTIAQCRQRRYHEQKQADSANRNSLSQASQPSTPCTNSNITPTAPASEAYVSDIPPATTPPEDPNLYEQDAHLLDAHLHEPL
jgi:hypothetical protein